MLLSGGLDSATCLALVRERDREAFALSVRYGQRHAIELERAAELARRLGATEHRVAEVGFDFIGGSALTDSSIAIPLVESDGIPVTYVPARNTMLLSLALGWAEVLGADEIVVGVNAVDYSGYPDCRPAFIEAFDRLAALATRAGVEGRPIHVVAPLLEWSKGRIVAEARRLGVPLERTISCYAPDAAGRPCMRCDACRLRARGFAEAGLEDR